MISPRDACNACIIISMVGIQCLYMFIYVKYYYVYIIYEPASQPTNQTANQPTAAGTANVVRHQCMLRVRGSQCKGGAARHSKQTNSSPAPTRPRHTPAHLNEVVHVYTTHILTGYIHNLVGGLEHEFYFPFSIWDNHSH